jgi:hypothetical protein
LIIGWIEENEIEGGFGGARNPHFHRAFEHGKIVLQGGEVFAQGFRGSAVLFDKKGGLGSTTKSFQAVGSGAGKKV